MSTHIDLGKEGEDLALEFLLQKGWKLLDRNFRFQKAEIDLVMQDKNQIVFIEVKTRESDYLVDPRLLITRGKQKQIIKTADFYLKSKGIDLETRFDIVIIVLNSKLKSLQHISNAFTSLA